MGIETIAIIAGTVASIASAAYGMISGAQTASFNEEVAKQQATYARQKAEFEAKQHEIKMKQLLAEQKVGYAGAGVSLMSGSVQDVTGDTLEQGAVDAMIIRYGGEAEAAQYTMKADQFGKEAGAAMIGGIAKIGSTLLTGAGSLAKLPAAPGGLNYTPNNWTPIDLG